MYNLGKFYTFDGLVLSVDYYAQHISDMIPSKSILTTLRLLMNSCGTPPDLDLFVKMCKENNNTYDLIVRTGLLNESGRISEPLSILVIKKITDTINILDYIEVYAHHNILKRKYFSDEIVGQLKENYEAFIKNREQLHDDYKIMRTSNVHEDYVLACVDLKRSWNLFGKSDNKGIIEKDLTYKIYTNISSFVSSVYNYIGYSWEKINHFRIDPKPQDLVVMPILGWEVLSVSGREIYVQVVPHIYTDSIMIDNVRNKDSYLQMSFMSNSEIAKEVRALQIKYRLDDNVLQQRLCCLSRDSAFKKMESVIDTIEYRLDEYDDQSILLDIGTIGDLRNINVDTSLKLKLGIAVRKEIEEYNQKLASVGETNGRIGEYQADMGNTVPDVIEIGEDNNEKHDTVGASIWDVLSKDE